MKYHHQTWEFSCNIGITGCFSRSRYNWVRLISETYQLSLTSGSWVNTVGTSPAVCLASLLLKRLRAPAVYSLKSLCYHIFYALHHWILESPCCSLPRHFVVTYGKAGYHDDDGCRHDNPPYCKWRQRYYYDDCLISSILLSTVENHV